MDFHKIVLESLWYKRAKESNLKKGTLFLLQCNPTMRVSSTSLGHLRKDGNEKDRVIRMTACTLKYGAFNTDQREWDCGKILRWSGMCFDMDDDWTFLCLGDGFVSITLTLSKNLSYNFHFLLIENCLHFLTDTEDILWGISQMNKRQKKIFGKDFFTVNWIFFFILSVQVHTCC